MQVIFNTLFMLEAIQVYIYDSKKKVSARKTHEKNTRNWAHGQFSIALNVDILRVVSSQFWYSTTPDR